MSPVARMPAASQRFTNLLSTHTRRLANTFPCRQIEEHPGCERMSFTFSRAALAPAKLDFGFYRERITSRKEGRLRFEEEENCHPHPISCFGALVTAEPVVSASINQGFVIFMRQLNHTKADFPRLPEAPPTFTTCLQIFMGINSPLSFLFSNMFIHLISLTRCHASP